MKNSLFNSENWLWQPFARVTDFLILSALWLLCSIPIVTAGAAFAALYDCCARCVRGSEGDLFTRFFRTFRRELLPGILSFLLWAAVLGGGLMLVRSFTGAAEGTALNLTLAYALAFVLALLVGIGAWVFPLLSRFTFSFGGLQITALRLSLAHLPRTIALAATTVAAGWVCLRFLLPVMVVPGIAGTLASYILEPVFQMYETGDAGTDN